MSDTALDDLLTVAQAAAILDRAAVEPRIEVVALAESLGRRLAEEVRADRDYPPFDKSLMDGFAVCAGAAAGEFELVGEVHAGQSWQGKPLSGRQAVAIMTGAPLPAAEGGHAGVIPVEESSKVGDRAVHLKASAQPDRYIARRGADREAGAVLLRPGVLLGPQQIAALASVGKAQVRVFSPPRCVVLATGDELVSVEATPKVNQIRNANSPTLLALLERLGADVVDGGQVPDDLDATRRALGGWLESSCDCLFVTGGMSMGQRDFVPRVLGELGVELHITKLKIKPGKPFVFGTRTCERGFVAGAGGAETGGAQRGRHTTRVFGLPGNPVSAYVCTLVLAARLLHRLAGGAVEELDRRFVEVPLAEALAANGPRQFYQPGLVEQDNAGGRRIRPLAWRGSADLFTLAQANALIERPAAEGARLGGSSVRALPLP